MDGYLRSLSPNLGAFYQPVPSGSSNQLDLLERPIGASNSNRSPGLANLGSSRSGLSPTSQRCRSAVLPNKCIFRNRWEIAPPVPKLGGFLPACPRRFLVPGSSSSECLTIGRTACGGRKLQTEVYSIPAFHRLSTMPPAAFSSRRLIHWSSVEDSLLRCLLNRKLEAAVHDYPGSTFRDRIRDFGKLP